MSVSLLLGLVYLISELLLTVTRRSRSRTGTKQDRSTLRVVWLVIIVSVAAGIYVAKYWPAAALPHHRSFVLACMVRHPSYTGVLLAFVGLGFSLGNWAALLVILLPIGAAFIRRMNVEENALLRALGPNYADYMKRTKRLVPFVY